MGPPAGVEGLSKLLIISIRLQFIHAAISNVDKKKLRWDKKGMKVYFIYLNCQYLVVDVLKIHIRLISTTKESSL